MDTRQELSAELTRRMQKLADRAYDEHAEYAGRTYISSFIMRLVHESSHEMERELQEIVSGLGKQYIELAPEMRLQFRLNVDDVEDAIRDFRRSIEHVYDHVPLVRKTTLYSPEHVALTRRVMEIELYGPKPNVRITGSFTPYPNRPRTYHTATEVHSGGGSGTILRRLGHMG